MTAIARPSSAQIKHNRLLIDQALTKDRSRLMRLWSRWKDKAQSPNGFEQALTASLQARQARQDSVPEISWDVQLPIAQAAKEILDLLNQHQVLVVAGETGSGKTTQLPKLCLSAGRGTRGLIGCTQPRRIAARSVATRVSEELSVPLGHLVGYQVRFADHVSENTLIKFMTDGILLSEITQDRWLSAYDTIIIDEAHERSLNIDFLLGYLKQLLPKRPDLTLIITSATINTERFSTFFDQAPVVTAKGRSYPIDIRYTPWEQSQIAHQSSDESSVMQAIVAAVDDISQHDRQGDILVFLPGEREIHEVAVGLERRQYRSTQILRLFARLSSQDQDRIFSLSSGRRIVLATNVAETSVTVPGIRYVIDPGYARVKRYSPRQKMDRLHVEPISQASANQRAGRCGRIAAGVCYRLYTEESFRLRAADTDPEIRRSSLAGVILRMLQLGLGSIEEFPFLDAPDSRAITDGWQQLQELGAINTQRQLTDIGRQMSRLPIDVKLARMLVAANQLHCLVPLVVIASFLSIQDPRERPFQARQAAQAAHQAFHHERSEFIGILRLWHGYRQTAELQSQTRVRQWCQEHFLNYLRMREWLEMHRQLTQLCLEMGWTLTATLPLEQMVIARSGPQRHRRMTRGQLHRAARLARSQSQTENHAQLEEPKSVTQVVDRRAYDHFYQTLHCALLSGLPTQLGHRTDRGDYQAPRQRRYSLFPASPIALSPPAWVVTAILLDTQRVWGLVSAAIDPLWAVGQLPHLLAHKYFDPHWSRAKGHVVGFEQISLFGLILVARKRILYTGVDPTLAHKIFVEHGLVTGEINVRCGFIQKNLRVLEQAREEEAKQRRAGLVHDEQWQARWYFDRVPADISSAAGLDAWWNKLTDVERQRLYWSNNDVISTESLEAERFPKYFVLNKIRLCIHYRFDPQAEDDGMTLEVPLHLLNAIDEAALSWLAPGFVAEKATALIRCLPKLLRRNFVPAPEFAKAFAEAYSKPSADSLEGELARFLTKTTGANISALEFSPHALEPHLLMNVRLRDAKGNVIGQSRDLAYLRQQFAHQANQALEAQVGQAIVKDEFIDFPQSPILDIIDGEAGVAAYPALVDLGQAVALRVFAQPEQARMLHRQGVRRLLELKLTNTMKRVRRQLPISSRLGLRYVALQPQQSLREDLVASALTHLCADDLADIRDAATFERRRLTISSQLFAVAMERLELVERIMEGEAQVTAQLEHALVGWARANRDDLQQQLTALIYPGFIYLTPIQYLTEYPRYLRAMAIRCERALRDPSADQSRMIDFQPLDQALKRARDEGKGDSESWQRLRWDLEELRVAVFAQELSRSTKISMKKFVQRLDELKDPEQ